MTEPKSERLKTTLVLHAGAIGDVVLGTLVPMALKRAQPNNRIIYWTHESLIELLKLCPSIDDFVLWEKRKSLWQQLKLVRAIRPETIVDLSGSLRSRIICWLSGVRTYTYKKQGADVRPILHAAANFLQTISPLAGGGSVNVNFPSLRVESAMCERLNKDFGLAENRIALVPGVGKLRSHRGWPASSWSELANKLQAAGRQVILVGGADDVETAGIVCREAPDVVNLCGKLSLAQTAAALSTSVLVVSGDTGPSHIAVAVGTPVVGLLGPTYPERSGPFGYVDDCFNAGLQCRCHALKMCGVTQQSGPGQCMTTISVDAVFEKVKLLGRFGCRSLF